MFTVNKNIKSETNYKKLDKKTVYKTPQYS